MGTAGMEGMAGAGTGQEQEKRYGDGRKDIIGKI